MNLKDSKDLAQKRGQGASEYGHFVGVVMDELERLKPDALVVTPKMEQRREAIAGRPARRYRELQGLTLTVKRREALLILSHGTWIQPDEGSCQYAYGLEVYDAERTAGHYPVLTLRFETRDALSLAPAWRLVANDNKDETGPLSINGFIARLPSLADIEAQGVPYLTTLLRKPIDEEPHPELGSSRVLPQAWSADVLARLATEGFVMASNG